MSYRIYTTPGLILKSMGVREASGFYWIYTRDLGLVTASAQGVRLSKSKLRFALQEYSISTISLVRGKGGWRITGALPTWNVYSHLREEKRKCATALNVIALIRRLVHGELPEPHLFDLVVDNLEALRKREFKGEEIRGFEALWVLQILEVLGYIGESEVKEEASVLWREEAWEKSSKMRKQFAREINEALKSTQL